MSIRVMSSVWANSRQRGTQLLILLALADFANDQGVCWPSIDTLAEKARCSRRQVQRAIRAMRGELEILENQGPNGVHLYRITVPVAVRQRDASSSA